MDMRIGTYITQTVGGEFLKAYIPPSLPLNPPIDLNLLYPYLERAAFAVAALNGVSKSIPNTSLFIYMYVRKEAVLSSQIEGTQSSLSDLILFENQENVSVSIEDVEEVSNYVKAIQYGVDQLTLGFPLSLRLLRQIHAILLSGGRGRNHSPGEFRRSQNWIGGTRPGNAFYVPPPVTHLNSCLSNLELFLHRDTIPTLIKAGIAHLQFESIHPFLDGNGRLGRLLIVLLLCESGMLDQPILYLSLYLKQNRRTYYELLQKVRDEGCWEQWLTFFLEGIFVSATQALQSAQNINVLFESDLAQIRRLGRARFSCESALEYLKRLPQVSVPQLAAALNWTAPTARSALNQLVDLGILMEISGKKRDKRYVYRKYLDLLTSGTEPL